MAPGPGALILCHLVAFFFCEQDTACVPIKLGPLQRWVLAVREPGKSVWVNLLHMCFYLEEENLRGWGLGNMLHDWNMVRWLTASGWTVQF